MRVYSSAGGAAMYAADTIERKTNKQRLAEQMRSNNILPSSKQSGRLMDPLSYHAIAPVVPSPSHDKNVPLADVVAK